MDNTKLETLKRNPSCLRVYSDRLKLSRDNGGYACTCPFHSEKTPSFKLSQKDGMWLWHCFGQCSRGGDVIKFVMDYDKVAFKTALKTVEDTVGLNWDKAKQQVERVFATPLQDRNQPKTFPLSRLSALENALATNEKAKQWLLKERGISYEVAKRLHLGLSMNGDKTQLVFPTVRGDVVTGVKFREMNNKKFTRLPGMATDLWNTDTIDPLEPVFVTEGEFDAIVLEQAGFHAVSLPSASKNPDAGMLDEIMQASEVYLAGDSDSAGRKAMNGLWERLQERTYLIIWPDGLKDANEVFLKKCGGDVDKFTELVKSTVSLSRSQPIANVYDMREVLATSDRTSLSDNPNRQRFPWPSVDTMVNLLPGSTLSLSATNTGCGKSTFSMNIVANDAKLGKDTLVYCAELDKDEYGVLLSSHLLARNRNHLTREDLQKAGDLLSRLDGKIYVGRNPDLTTITPVLDLIENAVRRLGVERVVLDHFHFVCRNEQNEVQAQADAMQRIKNMASKYGLVFTIIMQPRKADQKNKGKSNHITDLKGSAACGDDADSVIFLHRKEARVDDPNNPPKEPYEPKTEIHLKKGRSMGEGRSFALLHFHGETATFFEETKQEPPAWIAPEQRVLA